MTTQLRIAPTNVALAIVRGTDNVFEVTIMIGSEVVDITNDTVELVATTDYSDAPVFTKNNGPGEHSDPENGKTRFTILRSDQALLPGDRSRTTVGYYAIRRVAAGTGYQNVHLQGPITYERTVSPEIA